MKSEAENKRVDPSALQRNRKMAAEENATGTRDQAERERRYLQESVERLQTELQDCFAQRK